MAKLKIEGNDVVLRLGAFESVAAWRRVVRVPVPCLRMVHVEDAPLAGLSLLRLPGLCVPGVFAIGSCRRAGRSEFAAAYAHVPAVVLDTEAGPFDRLVVSQADAVGIAAELAALLLGRGPSKPGHRGTFPASLD